MSGGTPNFSEIKDPQNYKFDFNPKKPEGEDSDEEEQMNATLSAAMMNNPSLLNALQGQLGGLIGQNSGLMETLPQNIKDRIKGLKGLHNNYSTLEEEYKKAVEELDKKYEALYQPIFERRSQIVMGEVEPTEKEIEDGEDSEDEEDENRVEELPDEENKEEEKETEKEESPYNEDTKGIPDFWLNAMRNHEVLGTIITEEDEPLLSHLIDISSQALEDDDEDFGFSLTFRFSKNDYFENEILTKKYFLQFDKLYKEVVFDHAEATEIKWKPGKNLTVQLVDKTIGGGRGGRGGRGRGGRGGKSAPKKVIKVEQPRDSFFHFFSPPLVPDDDVADDKLQDLQEEFEEDYETGVVIKDKIIKEAVLWYTGEIFDGTGGDLAGLMGMEGESDSDDDEFDPEGQEPPPDCKQQ